MGILDSIWGKKSDPAGAAQRFTGQIPGAAHAGYDPYINTGMDATNRSKSIFDKMSSDPTAFLNELMKGYKTSEGYNFEKGQLEKEMSNTANAGGIAGTPYDQLNQATNVQGLLSKDMQQYLSNLLGINKTGLEGETHIGDRGFDASKSLTDILTNNLTQEGGLAFNQATQKNTDRSGIFQMLAKALGAGAGAIFGGLPTGGIGALPGAIAGSKIGGNIFGSI